MKIVLQRVKSASVTVSGKTAGSIGKGYLVLLGVAETDGKETADRAVNKIAGLRIFADDNGKTNLSAADVGGEILIVSQFTLLADCRKGNRPDFIGAAKPEKAKELYEYFIEECRPRFCKVQHGVFGADMEVNLVNDGPFTIVLDF